MNLHVVILAGGVGARFWPRSRQSKPKQYLSVFSEASLIQETVGRLGNLVSADALWVVTRADQKELVQSQLPELDSQHVLAEPDGRNTAPGIALAAQVIASKDPAALMLVLPSDHLIHDQELFIDTLQRAAEYVEQEDVLMTIGIQPNRPETGYGYILYNRQALVEGVHPVKAFVEKPDLETARRYVRSERYLWNAGMFLWRVSTIQSELKLYLPELSAAFADLPVVGSSHFTDALARIYAQITPCSIDYGVMEKSQRVCVIKGHFGWSDVGAWESVYDLSSADTSGNVSRGEIYALDTHDSYLYSPDRFTAVIGLSEIIVVDTPDALLICDRKRSQDVRHVTQYLSQINRTDLC